MSYEFSQNQNELIGSLSSKMRLVGLVNVVLGVLYLIAAVLLVVYIFQDRLPAEVTEKIPDEVRKQLPSARPQWGTVIQTAAAGVILLMIGVWTRHRGGLVPGDRRHHGPRHQPPDERPGLVAQDVRPDVPAGRHHRAGIPDRARPAAPHALLGLRTVG